MIYKRSSEINSESVTKTGALSGILATDGEAQDGHILNIDGGDFEDGAPMLFGHDDFSGSRNLGSWDTFDKVRSRESQ